MFDFIAPVYNWFTANWANIEGLARNIAADLAALLVLAKALAEVLKALPWQKPKDAGLALDGKVMGVFGK